jgi:hypothetical protein
MTSLTATSGQSLKNSRKKKNKIIKKLKIARKGNFFIPLREYQSVLENLQRGPLLGRRKKIMMLFANWNQPNTSLLPSIRLREFFDWLPYLPNIVLMPQKHL